MTTTTLYQAEGINLSDIPGLWEVIRIDIGGENYVYPWIQGRFMFNFLEDNMFVCFKSGKLSSGSWALTERAGESGKLFAIVINDTMEYIIIRLDEDEMVFTDRSSKYMLSRKF